MAFKKFSTPKAESRNVRGVPCILKLMSAMEAPAVLSHLLSDLGGIMSCLLSTPKESGNGLLDGIDEEVGALEAAQRGLENIRSMVTSMGLAGLSAKLKSGEVLDLGWYLEKLLVGNLKIQTDEGDFATVRSLSDLDEAGADVLTLWELVQYALQVNFHPIFGDLFTGDGNDQDHADRQEKAEVIQAKSNLQGETERVGH
jgi:hypothetical protein